MAEVIESGVGTYNYGRQSAKNTVATAASTGVGYDRPRAKEGSGLRGAKKLTQQEYVDGNVWASPNTATFEVGGQVGSVLIQAQPSNAGLYWAQMLASDVVTGAADPYTHTIASSGITQPYGSWAQKVGSAIGPQRELYWDSKISRLLWECGHEEANFFAGLGLDIVALKAAEIYGTDWAKTEDTSDPFTWSETSGAVTFDGLVDSDVDSEVVELNKEFEVHFGNSYEPSQIVAKKGRIVRTVTTIVTDDIRLKYLKALYNTTTPANGTRPVKDVFYAAISSVYTRSATRTLTITTPRVAVDPAELQIAPLATGGKIPISFGGACLKSGATAALTVVALTADSAAYV